MTNKLQEMIGMAKYQTSICLLHVWGDPGKLQKGTCIKGLIWPPLEPKIEN